MLATDNNFDRRSEGMLQFGDFCTIAPKIMVAVIEPAKIEINRATVVEGGPSQRVPLH